MKRRVDDLQQVLATAQGLIAGQPLEAIAARDPGADGRRGRMRARLVPADEAGQVAPSRGLLRPPRAKTRCLSSAIGPAPHPGPLPERHGAADPRRRRRPRPGRCPRVLRTALRGRDARAGAHAAGPAGPGDALLHARRGAATRRRPGAPGHAGAARFRPRSSSPRHWRRSRAPSVPCSSPSPARPRFAASARSSSFLGGLRDEFGVDAAADAICRRGSCRSS